MRFGIGLIGEHPPARMIQLVKLAEDLGFDRLWLTDERFHRDVYVNMTIAACHTERIGIGCMVTDPYVRHPALTAVAAATETTPVAQSGTPPEVLTGTDADVADDMPSAESESPQVEAGSED